MMRVKYIFIELIKLQLKMDYNLDLFKSIKTLCSGAILFSRPMSHILETILGRRLTVRNGGVRGAG